LPRGQGQDGRRAAKPSEEPAASVRQIQSTIEEGIKRKKWDEGWLVYAV
jgi:hypothetical protein